MSRTIEDIESQLSIRRAMKKQLREAKSLLREEGGFWAPFKDVLNALRLAAMDVSNSLRLVVGVIFTFDPEKINKKINEFDARRQKINHEWQPIVERAKASFDNADPILTMAIMGPSNFLAMQGIGAGLVAGKTAAEILTATNWNELVNSFTVQLDLDQSLQQFFQKYSANEEKREKAREREIDFDMPKGKRIQSILSQIFSETVTYDNKNLQEQSEKQSVSAKFSEAEAAEIFANVTGFGELLEKTRIESMKNLKETIDSLLSEIEPMRFAASLFSASDIKQMGEAFQKVKNANPKVDAGSYQKFIDSVKKESQKLQTNQKFIDNLKTKMKKQNMSSEEIRVSAEKASFTIAKKEFDKSLAKSLNNVVSSTEKAINDLRLDDAVIIEMKKSQYQDVKEVLNLYVKLLSVYKEIKDDFETKAKSKVI